MAATLRVWLQRLFPVTSADNSSSGTGPSPASNPTSIAYPYEYDGNGVPSGHVLLDVQEANGQFTTIDFEVDTGDYVPTMPASACEALGYVLTQGQESTLAGVDGQPFTVYTHQINVRLHGQTGMIQIPIAFSTLQTPLLAGWFGFLQHFNRFTFDNVAKALIFQ